MGLEERAETREVDGTTYRVTPLTTGPGLKVLQRLVKLIAPVLSGAFQDGEESNVANLIGALPDALKEGDLEYFSEAFGKGTQFKTGEGSWMPLNEVQRELHFAGRYPQLFKWLVFSAEVNFRGFFPGTGESPEGTGYLEKLKTMMASKSKGGDGSSIA